MASKKELRKAIDRLTDQLNDLHINFRIAERNTRGWSIEYDKLEKENHKLLEYKDKYYQLLRNLKIDEK